MEDALGDFGSGGSFLHIQSSDGNLIGSIKRSFCYYIGLTENCNALSSFPKQSDMKARADKLWEQEKENIQKFIKTIIDERWKAPS